MGDTEISSEHLWGVLKSTTDGMIFTISLYYTLNAQVVARSRIVP